MKLIALSDFFGSKAWTRAGLTGSSFLVLLIGAGFWPHFSPAAETWDLLEKSFRPSKWLISRPAYQDALPNLTLLSGELKETLQRLVKNQARLLQTYNPAEHQRMMVENQALANFAWNIHQFGLLKIRQKGLIANSVYHPIRAFFDGNSLDWWKQSYALEPKGLYRIDVALSQKVNELLSPFRVGPWVMGMETVSKRDLSTNAIDFFFIRNRSELYEAYDSFLHVLNALAASPEATRLGMNQVLTKQIEMATQGRDHIGHAELTSLGAGLESGWVVPPFGTELERFINTKSTFLIRILPLLKERFDAFPLSLLIPRAAHEILTLPLAESDEERTWLARDILKTLSPEAPLDTGVWRDYISGGDETAKLLLEHAGEDLMVLDLDDRGLGNQLIFSVTKLHWTLYAEPPAIPEGIIEFEFKVQDQRTGTVYETPKNHPLFIHSSANSLHALAADTQAWLPQLKAVTAEYFRIMSPCTPKLIEAPHVHIKLH